MNITQTELLELLMSVEKPTFVNIVSVTKPKMKKTNNPYFDKVLKTTKGNYFIGGTYEDMVIEKMKKEGLEPNFESNECSVGQHITKCVQYNENTKRHYLQYFTFTTSNIKSEFQFEGNSIEKHLFESYLSQRSSTSRQPQESKHDVKSFMLESIKEISINKEKYQVVD